MWSQEDGWCLLAVSGWERINSKFRERPCLKRIPDAFLCPCPCTSMYVHTHPYIYTHARRQDRTGQAHTQAHTQYVDGTDVTNPGHKVGGEGI